MEENLIKALELLKNHRLALYKDNSLITSEERGIKPMMDIILNNVNVENYSAADRSVGKAVAFLFAKAKIKSIHAEVLSKHATEVFDKYKIDYYADKIVPYIINRNGDDMCPMEKSVLNVDNYEDAFEILKNKMIEMKLL